MFSSNSNETGIEVTALEDDTEFILVRTFTLSSRHAAARLSMLSGMGLQVAGEPLDQEVVQYGPFVMTTKEEIQKTFIDCKWIFRSPFRFCAVVHVRLWFSDRMGLNGFEKAHTWKSKIGGL